MLFDFLWDGKGDKIKRRVMINKNNEGGLNMIDLPAFNKSLKTSWIKKCLDPTSKGKWKFVLHGRLEKFGGAVIVLMQY